MEKNAEIGIEFFEQLNRLHLFANGFEMACIHNDWPMLAGAMNFMRERPDDLQDLSDGFIDVVANGLLRLEASPDDENKPTQKDLLSCYLEMMSKATWSSQEKFQLSIDTLTQTSLVCKCNPDLRQLLSDSGTSKDLFMHDGKPLFSHLAESGMFAQAAQTVQGSSIEQVLHYIEQEYLGNQESRMAASPMRDLDQNRRQIHVAITHGLTCESEATLDFVETLLKKVTDDNRGKALMAHMACATTYFYLGDPSRTQLSDETFFDRLSSEPWSEVLRESMVRYAQLPRDGKNKWSQVDIGSEDRSDGYLEYEPEMLRCVLTHGIKPLFEVCRPLLAASAEEGGPSFGEFVLPSSAIPRPLSTQDANATFDYLMSAGHDPHRVRGDDAYRNAPKSAMHACSKLDGNELKVMLPLLLERGLDPHDDALKLTPVDKPLWDSIIFASKAKKTAVDLLASIESSLHP